MAYQIRKAKIKDENNNLEEVVIGANADIYDNDHIQLGTDSEASGKYTIANGNSVEARGKYSHAEGNHTIAAKDYQTVIGEYNEYQSQGANPDLFQIGNGTSDADRRNALEVNSQGQLILRKTIGSDIHILLNGGSSSGQLYANNNEFGLKDSDGKSFISSNGGITKINDLNIQYKQIPSGEDLDEYSISGFYYLNSGYSYGNCPVANGFLEVKGINDPQSVTNFCKQIIYRQSTLNGACYEIWQRTKWKNTTESPHWGEWTRVDNQELKGIIGNSESGLVKDVANLKTSSNDLAKTVSQINTLTSDTTKGNQALYNSIYKTYSSGVTFNKWVDNYHAVQIGKVVFLRLTVTSASGGTITITGLPAAIDQHALTCDNNYRNARIYGSGTNKNSIDITLNEYAGGNAISNIFCISGFYITA